MTWLGVVAAALGVSLFALVFFVLGIITAVWLGEPPEDTTR